MSRAFKSIDNQITSGSDYTRSIRNKTIYLGIERKVTTSEKTAESVSKYDSDYKIMWCGDGNGIPLDNGFTTAKLKSASSYEAYMNIARGKRIANPVLNGATASKFNIFTGNFAMVHPQTPYPLIVPTKWNPTTKTICPIPIVTSPPSGVDASQANTIPFPNTGQTNMALDLSWNENNYPGWFFDPYGVLSNYACIKSQAPNLGKKLVSQVEIIYRWSPAYWRSVAGQSLSGAAFPESVTFDLQPTENNELTQRYGPVASLVSQENTNEISAVEHDLNQLQSWCIQKGNDAAI